MLSPSASMPILIIFERHWDEAPKQIVKSLIPKLSQEGYDTLCFEAPQNLTESEILSSHNEGLDLDNRIHSQAKEYLERAGIRNILLQDIGFKKLSNLIRLYVSSQKYLELTEKIKGLPSSLLLKDLFNQATRLSLSIKGVDIDATDFDAMLSFDLSKRMSFIEKNEDYRIETIAGNLFRLHGERKGLIFICGALHAENLINKFKAQNIHDRVLYYFPHSNKNYEDSVEDVKEYLSNDTLKKHTFCLLDESDCQSLVNRIIREIKSSNTHYKKEIIGGNSHSVFLSHFFQKDFRAFIRPGYYVDALLDIDREGDIEKIVKKLQEVNVATHKTSLHGSSYLVVPEINTTEVADNLRRLND
jgi:hypothetical protein